MAAKEHKACKGFLTEVNKGNEDLAFIDFVCFCSILSFENETGQL